MLRRFFEDVLAMSPSFRSFLGDARANGEYENTASKEYKQKWETLVTKYNTIAQRPVKKPTLDTMSMKWVIKNEHELLGFPDEWMLLTSYENPILGFVVEDMYIYPLKTKRDVTNLIARTRKRIPFLQDIAKAMMKGVLEGTTIPRRICLNVIEQLEKMLKTQAYYVPIPEHLDSSAYMKVVDTEYVPVLYELLDFLKQHSKRCRTSIGLCHVKKGREMYRILVRSSTTMDLTPEEIHRLGRQGIKQLYKDFNRFKSALAASVGVREHGLRRDTLIRRIIADADMYYKNAEDVLKAYVDVQERIRSSVMPKYFDYIVQRYRIMPVPDLIKDSSTSAYYMMPSIKARRPGTVYINTTYVKRNPRYAVDVLSLHEGSPGHHYQYQYMKQHKMPIYRMYAADNDAYAEGWALYCESLVDTKDPKVAFGRWVYDMFRTVRLVVDTGIHYYGWSYTKALNYLKKHVPFEEQELITELDRYICMPSQAVSYKIGEQFFVNERDYFLENKLGDIKDFHKSVLECGPMPLDVLRHKLRHNITC